MAIHTICAQADAACCVGTSPACAANYLFQGCLAISRSFRSAPRPADNSGMASHLMTNVGPSVWARLFRGLGFTALVVTACSPLWGLAVFFALH